MAAAINGLQVIPVIPTLRPGLVEVRNSRVDGGGRQGGRRAQSSAGLLLADIQKAWSSNCWRSAQLRGRCRSTLGGGEGTAERDSDERRRTIVTQPPPPPSPEPHVNGAGVERPLGEKQSQNRAEAEKGGDEGLGIEKGEGDGGAAERPLLEALVVKVVEVASEAGDVLESTAETVAGVGELDLAPPEAGPSSPAGPAPIDEKEERGAALITVGFWVSAAALFGVVVGLRSGVSKASEFFAGYLLEQSLSVDNLFVFVLIFSYFKVPVSSQRRVLTYGIAGAVVFRGLLIGLGGVALQNFEALNLAFAAILLFSSYKLLSDSSDDGDDDLSDNFLVKLCRRVIPVSSTYDEDRFWTVVNGSTMATPLLLTLAVVELSDVAFAVDSIPAVFGVTKDPYIVFSSNIFAILGLRSLYTLISGSLRELDYLQPAVAVVLGFIGSKMVADFFGYHVSTEVSLGVVATLLGGGLFLSLRYPKDE